jgi:hypothetical protein
MGEGTYQFRELAALMPEGWEAQAKALDALRRSREIKTLEDLLLLIVLYLTEGKSFGGTSAIVRMEGTWQMTKKAVWPRICNSEEWLKWLCETICRNQGVLVEKPGWHFGKDVCLVDGSEAVLHGSKKKYFMLHYCVDLFSLTMKEMRLTDMETGEKLLNFKTFGKNDIVVGDRAYGTIPGMEHLRESGSGFVLRLRANAFNLYDGQGRKIELIPRLTDLKAGESRSIAVNYKVKGGYVPLRICAIRKDADSERAGLKRLKKSKQRKQHGKAVSATESEYTFTVERLSLWRELQAAQLVAIKSVLDRFTCLTGLDHIYKLPQACSDSRRKRIPRLCVFSSA